LSLILFLFISFSYAGEFLFLFLSDDWTNMFYTSFILEEGYFFLIAHDNVFFSISNSVLGLHFPTLVSVTSLLVPIFVMVVALKKKIVFLRNFA